MNDPVSVIRARRAEIALQLESLRAEDGELAAAEAVLSRLAGAERSVSSGSSRRRAPPPSQAPSQTPAQARRTRPLPRSQREFVLEALRTCTPPWRRTNDVLDDIFARWGVRIAAKSVRPLISGLKREGVIERQGRLIALAERARAPRVRLAHA
ncbi:MAG: hypothetical protein JNJ63_11135 [Hyphomonadaceae bacterium]|nr:hypothetical protein [Hyphomonadaceae bacterium]